MLRGMDKSLGVVMALHQRWLLTATKSCRRTNALNPRLIQQSLMLTFTQAALLHVGAVTMAGGSSGEVTKTAASGFSFATLFFSRREREEKT